MGVSGGKGLDPALMKSMQFIKEAQAREAEGDLQKAVLFYQAAAKTCPGNGMAYKGLLSLLLGLRDFENVGKVLSMIPAVILQESEKIAYMHGIYLLETGEIGRALEIFERLRDSKEINQGGLLNNIGTCYNKCEQYEEALSCYQDARSIGLDAPELWVNIAGSLKKLGRYREAVDAFREGLGRYPDNGPLRYEYALCLLTDRQYESGFGFYRSRWDAPQFEAPKPVLPLPELHSCSEQSKVLVVAEQGIGDQLLYSAGLGALQRSIKSLGLVVEPRLVDLMRRSNPGITVHTPEEVRLNTQLLTEYDGWISAPDVFCQFWRTIGSSVPFLQPDADKVAHYREKYRKQFPGKRLVGLSWKSKRPEIGVKKSVGMAEWASILELEDCVFVCLQYGNVSDDVEIARREFGVEIVVDDETDLFNDIDGTAALCAALDAVVTTSNSSAHIAAGVGVPVNLIAPSGVALLWYWGHSGSRCDWYPNVTVFRPESIGQWRPVLEQVASKLIEEESVK